MNDTTNQSAMLEHGNMAMSFNQNKINASFSCNSNSDHYSTTLVLKPDVNYAIPVPVLGAFQSMQNY
jgi:hypothetical protein